MSDRNAFSEGRTRKVGTNRIKTMEVFDLTNGYGSDDVTVLIKGRRIVDQPDDQSEARELRETARKSPWRDDKLKGIYANKSLSTRNLKDPIKELRLFSDSMTRK